MDGDNPIIANDKLTYQERLGRERMLRDQALNFHELGSKEASDLSDDMRGDKIDNSKDIYDTVDEPLDVQNDID